MNKFSVLVRWSVEISGACSFLWMTSKSDLGIDGKTKQKLQQEIDICIAPLVWDLLVEDI